MANKTLERSIKSAPANRRGRSPFHGSDFTTPISRSAAAVPAVADVGCSALQVSLETISSARRVGNHMVTALLYCTVFLLLTHDAVPAQTTTKPNGQVSSSPLPRLVEVVRVEAQPKKGFLYLYYFYVPPELW